MVYNIHHMNELYLIQNQMSMFIILILRKFEADRLRDEC